MHKFLKAAGFGSLTEKKIYDLIWKNVVRREYSSGSAALDKETVIVEYRRKVNNYIGICAAVVYAGIDYRELVYYFPYYNSEELSSESECSIERHTAADTYSGIIDEYSLGISLIFYINNPLGITKRSDRGNNIKFQGTYLAAFANEGTVILPVAEPDNEIYDDTAALSREELLEAAFGGDEDAIETLTSSDISMLQELSDRIEYEDLYSVVEQSFMPCGIECDQYSIIGEIIEVDEDVNIITNESLWLLRVSCNDISFRLCINKNSLIGEPMKGRRIKCRIWMQGRLDMPKQL